MKQARQLTSAEQKHFRLVTFPARRIKIAERAAARKINRRFA